MIHAIKETSKKHMVMKTIHANIRSKSSVMNTLLYANGCEKQKEIS